MRMGLEVFFVKELKLFLDFLLELCKLYILIDDTKVTYDVLEVVESSIPILVDGDQILKILDGTNEGVVLEFGQGVNLALRFFFWDVVLIAFSFGVHLENF